MKHKPITATLVALAGGALLAMPLLTAGPAAATSPDGYTLMEVDLANTTNHSFQLSSTNVDHSSDFFTDTTGTQVGAPPQTIAPHSTARVFFDIDTADDFLVHQNYYDYDLTYLDMGTYQFAFVHVKQIDNTSTSPFPSLWRKTVASLYAGTDTSGRHEQDVNQEHWHEVDQASATPDHEFDPSDINPQSTYQNTPIALADVELNP